MPKRKRKHRSLLQTSDPSDQSTIESILQAKTPNDVDEGTQPPEEMPEPPDSLKGETRYRKAYKKYFKRLLQDQADPEGRGLIYSGALSTVLQSLGMAPEVTEEEICYMLKSSGYANDDGTLGFEQFLILAKDFKLLESVHVHKKERERGNTVDRGLLGEFFEILDVGEETGFSSSDFADALGRLSIKITEETADNLVRYAYLGSGVKISFAQFEKVIYKERQKYIMQSENT